MTITARFADAENGTIRITEEGRERFVSASGPERTALDVAGIEILDFQEKSPRSLSYTEFTELFSTAEFELVRAATLSDPEAMAWALEAAADNSVSLDSPTVDAFLDKLVAAAIIDSARKTEIIS